MVLNVIWASFFIIGIVVTIIRVLAGDLEALPNLQEEFFAWSKLAVDIALSLIWMMALWLGIMKIGEDGGAVKILSRLVSPFFRHLFPGIPKDHSASGTMMMNFSANMLGLDNAATPLGLKAMKSLQELNPKKDTASDSMIMFLVLNVSGLTIIPLSVIAIRAAQGASNPTDIFLPILIATYFATLAGLASVALVQKINLFKPVVLLYLLVATAVMGSLLVYFQNPIVLRDQDLSYNESEIRSTDISAIKNELEQNGIPVSELTTSDINKSDFAHLISQPFSEGGSHVGDKSHREKLDLLFKDSVTPLKSKLVNQQSSLIASIVIFGIILSFLIIALFQKINVYESFITGAKEGFQVAINIIPYLVAMLSAVAVFRYSGAMEYLLNGMSYVVSIFGFKTDFMEAMPTALMKPLSGSGARAMAVEAMQTHGVDSFIGRLACCFQGSTETIFYVLAVYFGSVNIRKTRYTLWCGLFADVVGVTCAIIVARIFFGS